MGRLKVRLTEWRVTSRLACEAASMPSTSASTERSVQSRKMQTAMATTVLPVADPVAAEGLRTKEGISWRFSSSEAGRTPFSEMTLDVARSAARGSWVTITIVFLKSRVQRFHELEDLLGALGIEVSRGSSATRTWGSVTTARAMATRCSWPPES